MAKRMHKFGLPFRLLFPRLTWRRRTKEKVIYLTFDDGPIPEVTEYVLDLLNKYDAKATFFCVGDNIRKHPDIYKKVLESGNRTGNHTFHHKKGTETPDEEYYEDVEKCNKLMVNEDTKPLFRPPYGRIKRKQARVLSKQYEIIMWEVLTADYDQNVTAELCLIKSIQYTKKGSIVLFHDSVKTFQKIKYVLPAYLDHFKSKGYKFEVL